MVGKHGAPGCVAAAYEMICFEVRCVKASASPVELQAHTLFWRYLEKCWSFVASMAHLCMYVAYTWIIAVR